MNVYHLWFLGMFMVIVNSCVEDFILNQKLTGSTFKITEKSTLYSCASECVAYALCKSLNFDRRRLTCYLNFEDGVSYPDHIENNKDFWYSEIISWNNISLGPCQREQCSTSQYCTVHRNLRTECVNLHNLAKGKSASASSVHGTDPGVAIDGNSDSKWSSRSCFAVLYNDLNPWWQVDLEDVYMIVETRITARGDCCPERLHDFALEVYKDDPVSQPDVELQVCYMYSGAVTQPGVTVINTCTTPVIGRYLRVSGKNKLNENDLLQFCEVEVIGFRFVSV